MMRSPAIAEPPIPQIATFAMASAGNGISTARARSTACVEDLDRPSGLRDEAERVDVQDLRVVKHAHSATSSLVGELSIVAPVSMVTPSSRTPGASVAPSPITTPSRSSQPSPTRTPAPTIAPRTRVPRPTSVPAPMTLPSMEEPRPTTHDAPTVLPPVTTRARRDGCAGTEIPCPRPATRSAPRPRARRGAPGDTTRAFRCRASSSSLGYPGESPARRERLERCRARSSTARPAGSGPARRVRAGTCRR